MLEIIVVVGLLSGRKFQRRRKSVSGWSLKTMASFGKHVFVFVCLCSQPCTIRVSRMDIHDWCREFSHVALCRLINTSIFSLHKTWHEAKHYSQWTRELSGGCVNNKQTFLTNPQVGF